MLWETITKIRKLLTARSYLTYFNVPVKFFGNSWFVNERIVEIPFVLNQLDLENTDKRVMDFGCTRSLLALQLASLGFKVTGIDLRKYELEHPNFVGIQTNLKQFNQHIDYDYIISISVLEHVGLGAYGELQDNDDLKMIIDKLISLLNPLGGKLIITVPTGKPYQDAFMRSFSYDQIISLFDSAELKLYKTAFYRRDDLRYWRPCSKTEISEVSNRQEDRGPTGVNGVGCYVWKRSASTV